MKFATPLYVGEKAAPNKAGIIRGLLEKKAPLDTFVLVLPASDGELGGNQLEIVAACFLLQPYYNEKDIRIVGIASGKDDAIRLTAHIVEEAIAQIGSPRILDFLKERQRKRGKA